MLVRAIPQMATWRQQARIESARRRLFVPVVVFATNFAILDCMETEHVHLIGVYALDDIFDGLVMMGASLGSS